MITVDYVRAINDSDGNPRHGWRLRDGVAILDFVPVSYRDPLEVLRDRYPKLIAQVPEIYPTVSITVKEFERLFYNHRWQ